MGDNGDLQLYHDGSNNSYIEDDGIGSLNILTSAFVVKNDANTENILRGFKDVIGRIIFQ